MAEIAGLSLAANIIQMVEFGAQFTMMAYRIYESGNDAIENLNSIQVLSRNLIDVTQRLETTSSHASASQADEALVLLSHECKETSEKLLGKLERVGLPKSGKIKKRDALRTAFKAQWNKSEIDALEKRLDSFRNQLTLHVVEILRSVEKLGSFFRLYHQDDADSDQGLTSQH